MRIAYSRIFMAAVLYAASIGSAIAAENRIGFQLGAGLGTSHVRVDQRTPEPRLSINESSRGWKAFLGVRPLSFLGGEFSYYRLGSVTGRTGGSSRADGTAHQRGMALYAVGYLPMPIPLLDIFGKVGMARTESSLDTVYSTTFGVRPGPFAYYSDNFNESRFTWGAGAQLKLPVWGLALRAEFEQFGVSGGHSSLATIGVVWNL